MNIKNKKRLWQRILDALVWCLCLMALLWVLSKSRGRLLLYNNDNIEIDSTDWIPE